MKLFLFIWAILIPITACAQTQPQAILLSLNGKGKVKRGTKNIDLDHPGLFISNDIINITSGEAELLLVDGNDIRLSVGQTFKIPNTNSKNSFGTFASASSPQYYNLRGENSSNLPLVSKLNKDKYLQLNWKELDSTSIVTFSVFDKVTDSLLFENKNIIGSQISVDIHFPQGNYYWTIVGQNSSFSEIGEFSVTTDASCIYSNTTAPIEIMQNIDCLLKNNFLIEAFVLLDENISKYGNNSIFAWKRNSLYTK